MSMTKTFDFFITSRTLAIASALLLSACVPQEKTTQCSANEAFNASRRSCVPVVGAASSNTVFINSKSPSNSYSTTLGSGAINHSVSISDVYGYGYHVRWRESFTSSVNSGVNYADTAVANGVSAYSFTPANAGDLDFTGTYIIEAQVMDEQQTNVLDSVTWTVIVNDQITPSISLLSPNASAVTYPSNSTSETLSATINNADARNYIYEWVINSNATVFPTSSATAQVVSTNIDPSALGTGIHTVELIVKSTGGSLFSSYNWIVNVIAPDRPQIVASAPNFSETIIAIDQRDYSSGGYFYSSSYTPLPASGLCVTVDNYDKDGDTLADLEIQFDINGVNQGPRMAIGATNQACVSSDLAAQMLVNSQIGTNKTIHATTYVGSSSVLVEKRSWNLNIVPQNQTPQIEIHYASPGAGGCDSSLTHATDGCVTDQSVDDNGNNDYTDPEDEDNLFSFAIKVRDVETYLLGSSTISVSYQIKKDTDPTYQDLDTSSSYSKTDCTALAQQAAPTGWDAVYQCPIAFDAFVNDEPVEPGVYKIKAFVTDSGSAWTGSSEQSNEVTWEVTVSEINTTPQILAQAATTGSYIELADSSCNANGHFRDATSVGPGSDAQENCKILIHTKIYDRERDDMRLAINLEDNLGAEWVLQNLSAASGNYDNDGVLEVTRSVTIPEYAIRSASNGVIKLKLQATEVTDQAAALSTTQELELYVENDNPAPTFDDYAGAENTSDLIGTQVFAGYPFTLTPPTFSDDSNSDGKNVTWQWQVCYGGACTPSATTIDPSNSNGNWVNIPNTSSVVNGASTPELIWTPSLDLPTATMAHLRVCLGDDGTGNPNDCTQNHPESRKTYQNIEVINSKYAADSQASSGQEVGSWYDEVDEKIYSAYATGNPEIIVEKHQLDASGEWTRAHAIRIVTDNTDISDISIDGINQEVLYVAYKIINSANDLPQIMVHRIDISNGKFSYHPFGLYVDELSTSQLIQTRETDIGNVTFASENRHSTLRVDFSGAPSATDDFEIISADGTTTYTITGFCATAPNCGTPSNAATAFFNALSASDLTKEFQVTQAGNIVRIIGPRSDDYFESQFNSPVIGNIQTDPNPAYNQRWYIPYASGSDSLKLKMLTGNEDTTQNASSYIVNSSESFNSQIKMVKRDIAGTFNLAIVAKNAMNNASLYSINASNGVLSSPDIMTNIFDFSSAANFTIADLSISSGANLHTYIGIVSQDTSNGERYLGAAAAKDNGNGTWASIASHVRFQPTAPQNFLIQRGISEVKVAASPDQEGVAYLAITTNSDHDDNGAGSGVPNQAFLAQIKQDNPTGWTSNNFNFVDYQVDETNNLRSSPKLNLDTIPDGSAISLTPVFTNVTRGVADEAASPNSKPVVFFSWHEFNGADNRIKGGMFNVQSENILTNSADIEGSYPAILAD